METKQIHFNSILLKGNVFTPPGVDKAPGVLFIHGWQSSQNRLFSLAKELSEKGFTCLTFDLPGHGQSNGDINTYTIKDYLDASITAYDFLVKTPTVNPTNIIVVGSSFGSYLATILTSKRLVQKLVLRVPANYPDHEFLEIKAKNNFRQPNTVEWRTQKLDSNGTMSLNALHYFTGDILIVESEKDKDIPHQGIQNYLDAITDKQKLNYVLMKEAPHSLSGHEALIKQYNTAVVDWLQKTL